MPESNPAAATRIAQKPSLSTRREFGETVHLAAPPFTITAAAVVAAAGDADFFSPADVRAFADLKSQYRELLEREWRWNHDATKERLAKAADQYYRNPTEETWKFAEQVLMFDQLALLEAARRIRSCARRAVDIWWKNSAVPALIPIGERLIAYLEQELDDYRQSDQATFKALGVLKHYTPSDALRAVSHCLTRVRSVVDALKGGQQTPIDPEIVFDKVSPGEVADRAAELEQQFN